MTWLANVLPPGVSEERPPMPPWLAQRWAAMHAWGDANLTGERLTLFREFCERTRYVGTLRGNVLRRAKGTADPWDMATPHDVAVSVHYYEFPRQDEDEHLWESLCDAMLNDQRLTHELAESLSEKARMLPSATPQRLNRLRGAFARRFSVALSLVPRRQQWDGAFDDC